MDPSCRSKEDIGPMMGGGMLSCGGDCCCVVCCNVVLILAVFNTAPGTSKTP